MNNIEEKIQFDTPKESLMSDLGPIAEYLTDESSKIVYEQNNAMESIHALEGTGTFINGEPILDNKAAETMEQLFEGGKKALESHRDSFESARKQSLTELEAYKKSLQNKILELNRKIVELNRSIANAENELGNLRGCTDPEHDHGGEIAGLESEIASLKNQLESTQSQLNACKSDLEWVSSRISSISSMVNPIEATLNSFVAGYRPYKRDSGSWTNYNVTSSTMEAVSRFNRPDSGSLNVDALGVGVGVEDSIKSGKIVENIDNRTLSQINKEMSATNDPKKLEELTREKESIIAQRKALANESTKNNPNFSARPENELQDARTAEQEALKRALNSDEKYTTYKYTEDGKTKYGSFVRDSDGNLVGGQSGQYNTYDSKGNLVKTQGAYESVNTNGGYLYGEQEAKDVLKASGYNDEQINDAVSKLKENGQIDESKSDWRFYTGEEGKDFTAEEAAVQRERVYSSSTGQSVKTPTQVNREDNAKVAITPIPSQPPAGGGVIYTPSQTVGSVGGGGDSPKPGPRVEPAPMPTTTMPMSTTTMPMPTTTMPIPTTTMPIPTTTMPIPTTTMPIPTTTHPYTPPMPMPSTTKPYVPPIPTTTLPQSQPSPPVVPTYKQFITDEAAGILENPETGLKEFEDYNADEEGIPTMIMNNIKPVVGKKSKGSKAIAALSGLAATGAVAGGLAFTKKKKDEESGEELYDQDDEELSNIGEENDGDKVTELEEDKPWLSDYGLGITRENVVNDDIGF